MTGPVNPEVASMPDLRARELWAVGPLIALIIVLGVYPKPAIDLINPAVHQTLVQAHSTDPVPPHPASAVGAKVVLKPSVTSAVKKGN
jgi:NADH-quinone oxidoreductase subunit M